MTSHARGLFEVTMTPQPAQDGVGDPAIGRMALDKRFQGDLQATSKGQMLALRTDTEGSAGYVALERVEGSLHGRHGAFALQHSGTMTRGEPQLQIGVVPDSGSGGLSGLTGTLQITVVDGKHAYDFEYSLPGAD